METRRLSLILGSIFVSACLFAGTKYPHKEVVIKQEFENIYSIIDSIRAVFSNDGSELCVGDDWCADFDNGYVTQVNQPSFLALAGSQTNVTGDGTVYNVSFGTEVRDRGSDFLASTFTAPVDGDYLLTSCLMANGLTSSHTSLILYIVTSNRTYQSVITDPSDTNQTICYSVIADMESGDTARVDMSVDSSTKVVGLTSAEGRNSFSGTLLN